MLTYLQVHLYFILPSIFLLLALYWPLLGRRDVLKILFLMFMATAWTTPWDNFVIYHGGWTYPPGSILGTIFHIPIEEHMFFILQPILVILLFCLMQHPHLLPFELDPSLTRHLDINHVSAGPDIASELASSAAGEVVDIELDGREDVAQSGGGEVSSGGKARNRKGKRKAVNAPSTASSPTEPSETVNIHIETRRTIQTLPRRPLAASFWIITFLAGVLLVNEAHDFLPVVREWTSHWGLRLGKRAFYLGWILIWITPVIGWLTWLGGRCGKVGRRVMLLAGGWLCFVDTVAIRNGAWSISNITTLRIEVWRGLPLEECLFFILTTHLLIISASLISHLHTLLVLCPTLPPCPPVNPFYHVALLARVAFDPPEVDVLTLQGLAGAQETLRKGSKSFEVAKLAFGREMRLGLVAIYAWCRVTDNLIDDVPPSSDIDKYRILETIRAHLELAFGSYPVHPSEINDVLDGIPQLTPSDRSAFHLFSNLIPRLAPIQPFLELCDGYETDMRFASYPLVPTPRDIEDHLPIRTSDDLLRYADDVAGSIASAICYLAWSVLDSKGIRPVNLLKDRGIHQRATDNHHGISNTPQHTATAEDLQRKEVVKRAREMGRALQLVNIARDVAKDAVIYRLYVPISFFPSASAILSILLYRHNYPTSTSTSTSTPPPSYSPYTIPILDLAETLRDASISAIDHLPRTARGGTRAMVASYFEIGHAVRRNKGEVDERGVKVGKWRRLKAAGRAMWLG